MASAGLLPSESFLAALAGASGVHAARLGDDVAVAVAHVARQVRANVVGWPLARAFDAMQPAGAQVGRGRRAGRRGCCG